MAETRDLIIDQILLLLNFYEIEVDELYAEEVDSGFEDILEGDDFLAYKVSNVNKDTSNAVFLLRKKTAIIDGATLPTLQGWVQIKQGYNPNDYDFKIIAIKK